MVAYSEPSHANRHTEKYLPKKISTGGLKNLMFKITCENKRTGF